ncbi:MAG TPA: IclR family transcriptional regulator [Burkholderiaceae bacterium]|nr:IclR family transcriptional regulator [Burkholderiaceae bacterium]
MGLQTVDRAVAALHLLSASGPGGMRLVDVQGKLRLSKPTAHRLLMSLVSHGFVDQDEMTKRYRLGTRLAVLAWSVPQRRPDFGRLASPAAQRLAQRSGDTVFLMACDGLESVCVGRETGSFPIKALTIEVGTRRPLGVGAGGLAVLGAMPVDDARRAIDAIAPKLKDYPLTSPEVVQRSADQARRLGYSVSDGQVATGVRAIAVAVRDVRGVPVGSIGIAAIRSRMMPDRIKELVPGLLEERAEVERLLAA